MVSNGSVVISDGAEKRAIKFRGGNSLDDRDGRDDEDNEDGTNVFGVAVIDCSTRT